MNQTEKCLDSQLWHACAGGMVQLPPVNSPVFYFPQGHAEHAAGEKFNPGSFPGKIPSLILCKVSSIKFLADSETDEVYAKLRLIPSKTNGSGFGFDDDDDGFLGIQSIDKNEKPVSFAKTLTQSDANNGGGFSVPRYCAETIFPRLDYSSEPPVQTIICKDVHGNIWKFRHIYRGTPRRHLLTTGWSNFVNKKKLITGDSVVFLRANSSGDLRVGIRRAKRGIGGSLSEFPSGGWNTMSGNCGYSWREEGNKFTRNVNDGVVGGEGRVRGECVIEATNLAVNGQPFEVVYYPRASAPEFCVKASAVRDAMRIQWFAGMRFKMAFETEDSSRISWFMGTISSVQVDDPIRWPNSPWRLLQVAWDEPDLLQNVKRVSPWLVELVSNMPSFHHSPFSPPRKKLRVPLPSDFPFIGQFPLPPFPSNPLCCVSDNTPAGIQGARHAHFGLPLLDVPYNKLQSGLSTQPLRVPIGSLADKPEDLSDKPEDSESISCLLTIGISTQNLKKDDDTKTPMFLLFGQPILTEQQISQSFSGDTMGNSSSDGSTFLQNVPPENSSDDALPWYKDHHKSDFGLETGHCKVFVESEDVGRTLDLSALGSYEELYRKMANMFGIESSEILSNVLYRDVLGAMKHAGDEPFSDFSKTAKRLTILMDSGSDNMGK